MSSPQPSRTSDPDPHARRATALGEVLRHATLVPGPATWDALFTSTMKSLGLPEEQCGSDIYDAMSLLARSGLLECSTHDATGVAISAETVFTPSQPLIDFAWSDR